jgi:hypothetical protein
LFGLFQVAEGGPLEKEGLEKHPRSFSLAVLTLSEQFGDRPFGRMRRAAAL